MKVTFVRPNLRPERSSDAMEPLVFAILQSLTPPGVTTELVDERLEDVSPREDRSRDSDLVAITVETYTARRAYQLADEYRARGARVVLGGYHATFLPDEALAHADAVVVGDAEGVWPRVVADARRGTLKRIYRSPEFPSLRGVRPDRSIFRGKRYAPASLVQWSRGCRFACEFCSIRAFYGSSLRLRPVSEVAREVECRSHRHLFLVDDNLYVDEERLGALCDALEPLNVRWSCQITLDVAERPKLVERLARAGCTTAVVGIESLDETNLRRMKKRWNVRGGPYTEKLRILREAGIMIYGTFVFGYEGDTPDSFDRAVDFALENSFYLANFNPLTPTPGAALYDRLRLEGRLLHDRWWLDPSYRYGDATFQPRGMTPDELTAGCRDARLRFNRWSSIGRRLVDPLANMRGPYRAALYVASNVISRREVRRKQGVQLGAPEGSLGNTNGRAEPEALLPA